jgi:hypothetical protein
MAIIRLSPEKMKSTAWSETEFAIERLQNEINQLRD